MIRPNDTEAQVKAKLKKQSDNYVALERIKMEKAEEIVNQLNLFAGQLSLSDILDTPIPMLEQLMKAKMKLNKEQLDRAEKLATKGQKKK